MEKLPHLCRSSLLKENKDKKCQNAFNQMEENSGVKLSEL